MPSRQIRPHGGYTRSPSEDGDRMTFLDGTVIGGYGATECGPPLGTTVCIVAIGRIAQVGSGDGSWDRDRAKGFAVSERTGRVDGHLVDVLLDHRPGPRPTLRE